MPVSSSIKNSFKEIKEFKMNKRPFKTLEESQKMWDKWVNEMIDIKRWKGSKERFKFKVKMRGRSRMSVLAINKPNAFVIKKSEANNFIKEFNENVISESFLEGCKKAYELIKTEDND